MRINKRINKRIKLRDADIGIEVFAKKTEKPASSIIPKKIVIKIYTEESVKIEAAKEGTDYNAYISTTKKDVSETKTASISIIKWKKFHTNNLKLKT